MSIAKPKRITIATVKSFIRKNEGRLFIRFEGHHDAMSEAWTSSGDRSFTPARMTIEHMSHSLGIGGAWFVGRSRDYLSAYNDVQFTGIHVSNCCSSFTIAVAIGGA